MVIKLLEWLKSGMDICVRNWVSNVDLTKVEATGELSNVVHAQNG